MKERQFRYLVEEHGANITAKENYNRYTPLYQVCNRYIFNKGKIEVAKYLVEHGVIVITKDKDGRTPLHYACKCANLDIIIEEHEC